MRSEAGLLHGRRHERRGIEGVQSVTRAGSPDEPGDSYEGSIVTLAHKYDLAWALDPDGRYLGGTDRATDQHFLAWDRGQVVGILKFRVQPGELHLAHILVAPTHRLRHRAGKLLDRLLGWAERQHEFEGFAVTCEIPASGNEQVETMLTAREFILTGTQWRRAL
jgi:GNAT superfamily N-acetyltransferase